MSVLSTATIYKDYEELAEEFVSEIFDVLAKPISSEERRKWVKSLLFDLIYEAFEKNE